MAVCRRHAEKPTEGVSGPAAQAAEPTTVAIRRLKCSELIRRRRYVEEPAKALDGGKRALRPWHFFATDTSGGIAKFSQANSRNPGLDRKGSGQSAKARLVRSEGSYCGTSASGLYRTRGLDWQVAHHAGRRSGLRHQADSIHSAEYEQALNELRDRIQAVSDEPNADYKITDVVAFGDLLGDAARVQAAEVGIRLTSRGNAQFSGSAKEHRAELAFLKGLRGKTALLKLVPYENWMRADVTPLSVH
jgi:hypothetical protein